MKSKPFFIAITAFLIFYIISVLSSGCAQIGSPTGGIKDTLPPVLLKVAPAQRSVEVIGNKITFSFDEYIELQDVQSNVFVSPYQNASPIINSNLKTITVKFKDSLRPNTTYRINFGNAIKDINEGNVLKNLTYIFSTGSTIDSLRITGNVMMAETGKVDSTLLALLYKNTDDSAVLKRKPDYIARINSEGNFEFNNLPAAKFKLYALKDGDGSKTYNAKTEIFAFIDKAINTNENILPVEMFAYAEQKASSNITTVSKTLGEKKLRYSTNAGTQALNLLQPLELSFNNKIKTFDLKKISLTDTNFNAFPNAVITTDSFSKKIFVKNKWKPGESYLLILFREAVQDIYGNFLSKSDTIRFITKKETDYGSVILRFKNLDLNKHPILQFMEGETIKFSSPITSTEWSNKLFLPGDYEIRILYDLNNNGEWDPGNYPKNIQPERAVTLPQKLNIKADWENERDIVL